MSKMIPGHLYRINAKHHHWGNENCMRKHFLCTKPMHAAYGLGDEGRQDPSLKETIKGCALININNGGLWNAHSEDHAEMYDDVTQQLMDETE